MSSSPYIWYKIARWLWQFLSILLIDFALGGITFFSLSLAGLMPVANTENGDAYKFVLLNNTKEAIFGWLVLQIGIRFWQKIKPTAWQYILLIASCHVLENSFDEIFIYEFSFYVWLKVIFFFSPVYLVFGSHIFIAISIVYYMQTREQKRTHQISEQAYQLLALQEMKTKAELEALHAKINPHFLYNSLNSIAGLIHLDADKAERMVLLLSKFFRYSTRINQGHFNTIENELEIVKTYLEVEMVRFEDRLEYEISLESPLLKGKIVPNFLLQPLVENALKHGISKLAQKGKIAIHVTEKEGFIFLEISDNGVPFPEHTNLGYGLQSTQDKIRILGGEGADMEITNTPYKRILIRLSNELKNKNI